MCTLCGNPFHISNDQAAAGTGESSSALPTIHLNPAQAGAQITRNDFHWGTTLGNPTGPITYAFRLSPTGNNYGTEISTFSQLTSQQMAAVGTVMQQWAAVANITFTQVNPSGYSNSAAILFANYFSVSDGAQAYTYLPGSNNQSSTSSQGDVWFNTAFESTTSLPFGGYDFFTIIHEIGHALGLEHPGAYNAAPGQFISYANNAEYVEDTRQYTVMSYFNASNTGANHVYNGQTIYASTLLMHDIAAVQRLYGVNTNFATGNTVYGANSNASAAYHITNSSQQVVFCIWDGGGVDTLDCSIYSTSQVISLIAGSFSNVGALTYNVSIAEGTIIENAIGGSGNDTLYGNEVGNYLAGGAGNDHLYGYDGNDTLSGGSGTDWAHFTLNLGSYAFNVLTSSIQVLGEFIDTVWNDVEWFAFADATLSYTDLSTWATLATVIESNGDYDLVLSGGRYWIQDGAGTDVGLSYNGAPAGSTSFSGWSAIQAEESASGGFNALWQHTNGSYVVWQTSQTGVWQSSTFTDQAGLVDYETTFQTDLNGDGIMGAPASALGNGEPVAVHTGINSFDFII